MLFKSELSDLPNNPRGSQCFRVAVEMVHNQDAMGVNSL